MRRALIWIAAIAVFIFGMLPVLALAIVLSILGIICGGVFDMISEIAGLFDAVFTEFNSGEATKGATHENETTPKA